ncbi:hypothetical protein HYS54_02265 [Candidatus Micrarchaeota archaeon]|nr:hypothetical protein [Candidatus Micrarchaeota archaeon]
MKTYLSLWFNSDGAKPTQVVQQVEKFGFRPLKGNYDFEYDWGSRSVSNEEILALNDRLQARLKNGKVVFKSETV